MDAYQVWREAAGQSKQKSIRAIWAQLADALDGVSAAGPQDEQQPLCAGCGGASGRLAIGRAGELPVCGRCAGQEEFRSRGLTLVSQWRAGWRK